MSNPEELSPLMQTVKEIRDEFEVNGRIKNSDVIFLLDKMETGERLAIAVEKYKNMAEAYIEQLKADLLALELSKDIEIHELKERLAELEPDTDA